MEKNAFLEMGNDGKECDNSSLIYFVHIDYDLIYDEKYLKSLRDKAKISWLGNIDPDNWLNEIRGGY